MFEKTLLATDGSATILRVADVGQCHLIVMVSRGYGELASLFLSNVSHRVLAHARAPVMIVKAKAGDERA